MGVEVGLYFGTVRRCVIGHMLLLLCWAAVHSGLEEGGRHSRSELGKENSLCLFRESNPHRPAHSQSLH
jgi:hypothetical protein